MSPYFTKFCQGPIPIPEGSISGSLQTKRCKHDLTVESNRDNKGVLLPNRGLQNINNLPIGTWWSAFDSCFEFLDNLIMVLIPHRLGYYILHNGPGCRYAEQRAVHSDNRKRDFSSGKTKVALFQCALRQEMNNKPFEPSEQGRDSIRAMLFSFERQFAR